MGVVRDVSHFAGRFVSSDAWNAEVGVAVLQS